MTNMSIARGPVGATATLVSSRDSAFASVSGPNKAHRNRFRTRTIEKNVLIPVGDIDISDNIEDKKVVRLGKLDNILISPSKLGNVKEVPGKKIAAILREQSPLELQRHLITTTVQNEVSF